MINIDHVSFQYSGAERENLQDFILQIPNVLSLRVSLGVVKPA